MKKIILSLVMLSAVAFACPGVKSCPMNSGEGKTCDYKKCANMQKEVKKTKEKTESKGYSCNYQKKYKRCPHH
jgi:hypothetical protein